MVFGQVVSGQDVVRQIENLPVDRNSRPLEEPVVKTCGELVKQVKGERIYSRIDFSSKTNSRNKFQLKRKRRRRNRRFEVTATRVTHQALAKRRKRINQRKNQRKQ